MESLPWLKPQRDLEATTLHEGLGIDMAAQVETPDGGRRLIFIEAKQSIRPSEVEGIAQRLRAKAAEEQFNEELRYAGTFDRSAKNYFVLAAPWLSSRTTDVIRKESDFGWFDLAGNAHLDFPGAYLHVEGISNPFKSKERTISWKSRHAQRVLRELLKPKQLGQKWRQRALAEACFPSVSIGTVNKVAKRLVDFAYAEETDQGLRLTDPEGLLRDWAKHYQPIHQTTHSFYTTLNGDALQNRLQDTFSAHQNSPPDTRATIALAGTSAAKWFAPFLRSPSLYCYATPSGERALIQDLDLQPTEKGANVILWITPRSGPFSHRIHLPNGITTTSLVQTYLDLYVSGERGREAAEHILSQKLLPQWNEWKFQNQ
jgi:hypothetical protein